MSTPFAIAAAFAAAAFTAPTPAEKERLIGLANQALAETNIALGKPWISFDPSTGLITIEGEHDPNLIMSSGGGAVFDRFGVPPDPETQRAIWRYQREHPEANPPPPPTSRRQG